MSKELENGSIVAIKLKHLMYLLKTGSFIKNMLETNHTYEEIENIIENSIKQSLQPNKEQLRDEIISEFEQIYSPMKIKYTNNANCICFQLDKTTPNFLVFYDKENKKVSWHDNDYEIPLASKIIKYFELESDDNE